MKRILPVFLSILFLLTALPLGAIPVAAATSGTTGNCTWMLDGTHLTISGNGAMDNYSCQYVDGSYRTTAPWGRYVTSVTIEEGVTTIGDYAFYSYTLLTPVIIPDSVITIGEGAFSWCTSLESVTIGDSVTIIGKEAFSYCTRLTSVTIPDSVTTIEDGAFLRCESFVSISIPDGVTTIGKDAFFSCDSLTMVTIPASVTTIGPMVFRDCESLQSIVVDENNPYFSSLDGVLFNKDQSTLLHYVGGKAGAYTIPDSVTTIGEWAFDSCYLLTSVTIPDSVTTIEHDAFNSCVSLESVFIPDSVTYIRERAFAACDSLKSIVVDENNPYLSSLDGVLFSKDQSVLLHYLYSKSGVYTIPDSVTNIGFAAFDSCTSLTSVTIPDSVTTIQVAAFEYCSSLTSVTIGNSVTTIGVAAFWYCPSLESVHYHGTEQDKNAMDIGLENENLLSATWHYYDNACDTTCNECDVTRSVQPHRYDYVCDESCNACGAVREAQEHIYSNACDRDCNVCGAEREVDDHVYDDEQDRECNLCGALREVPDVAPGDINNDGKVNVRDIGLMQQYMNGWSVELNLTAADVNADGKVNVRDLGLLQQYLNGWDVELLLPGVATGEMVWPVPICQNISRGYSDDHPAIDISNGPIPILGKPCVAADGGTVSYVGWDDIYGNVIEINHGNGLYTKYAHLQSVQVTLGQKVACGQTIGLVGMSGDTYGPHLHFEVIKDGEKVNPLDCVMPSE